MESAGPGFERVRGCVERYGMVRWGRRMGVAVSGGADSVFLLLCLKELGLATLVLHVNHLLRGEESEGDARFVGELATGLGLEMEICEAPVPAGNTEQEARVQRYRFFESQIAGGACDAVATGHTLDDQAETVLFRFLRGSGSAGLSGIRPVLETGVVRPLLETRRDAIRKYLRERNISWREDHSNEDTTFLRNRIRGIHMPALTESLNPSLAETLATTATLAQGEEDFWRAEIDRLEGKLAVGDRETVRIQTGDLCGLPVAAQRRLLRRMVERVRGTLRGIDFRHVETMREMAYKREGSGRMQLPDLDIYRSFDWLRLSPVGFDSRIERDFEVPLATPGRTELRERLLTIDVELVKTQSVYNDEMVGLDGDRIAGSLRLRNWRPGDQYSPQGRFETVKIKTLFQDFRVPLWERRGWPVVDMEPGGSIVWSRGFGVSSEFRAGPECRNVLWIREVKESNSVFLTSIEVKRAALRKSVEGSAEVL